MMRRRVTHLRVIDGGRQERAAVQQLHPVGRHIDVDNVSFIRRIEPDYPDLRAYGRIRLYNDDGTSTVYETDPTRPAA
jgi:hypothetical protein